MTRFPSDPDDLDGLDEIGDDAIIAQQMAAHAPQPRAVVSEEVRSVVISDPPHARDTQPPRRDSGGRAAAEPTLIIRDRRRLEEMRQQILQRQSLNHQRQRSRAIYLWGALGLVAFVLGGVVAFIATGSGPAEAVPAREIHEVSAGASPPSTTVGASVRPEPVRLDDLPIERAK